MLLGSKKEVTENNFQGVMQTRSLDIRLFDPICSQTTIGDREALLLMQELVSNSGSYVYLEIGSYLGGTIQPHLCDPLCKTIYSIDKRTIDQTDERGINIGFTDNSTTLMLRTLRNAFPLMNVNKIRTFSCDASEVNKNEIKDKPHIIFIDGEHTNTAVYSDFMFCLEICHSDAII